MTNIQAIQSYGLLNYPVKKETFELSLINAGLNPNEEYVASNQRPIELCVADLLLMLITSARIVSDDGYKVEMQDITELWRLRAFFRTKWGLSDDTPITGNVIRLKDASNKW